ncbi:NfeD family protein [Solemya elarraichensis gill symbiont]|uniref:Serine protease n=1 Tax=Solemya elarraichensis gill symbiont TaxID=1918949 RepID=A0A1T2KYM1_9GAMM|nr:nodulation protein NfeD [Solemya elarraichensis gill symbiont]OOZ37949.1 serine protease [Solemya elarraichensis gill symbiont]
MLKLTKGVARILFFVIVGVLLNSASANRTGHTALQLSIDGAIGPATEDYIERSLISAEETQTELVIIRMDTPGGLDTAMRGIIKHITNSSIPVVSYVAPSGSRAASAGTYIVYASHIAAMAPATNLGAATPVKLGGISPPDLKERDDETKSEDEKAPVDKVGKAKKEKIINDAVAYIRGLAELHNRNQEWAEKAVREAASLQASEALKLNVIDIIAIDTSDLLKQINDREVLVQGQKRTLHTTGLTIVPLSPDWRSRLLSVITNPNVAYILMLIGIYGLIFEFSNPGAIVPGTVGAICLLVALYAFQLLPINYAGMGLILLGMALMIGEAFELSFGMLGIGGVIAFVIGSIILMDTDVPGFGIDISVIITFTVTSILMFIIIIGMAIKARRRPVVSGMEGLIGGEATVISDFDHNGTVTIHSETWTALSETPLHKGQKVKVTNVEGLTLNVEPLQDTPAVSTKQEEEK